jgi:hypothetical protein
MVGRRIPSGARVRHGTAPLPPLVGINGCPTRPPVRARNAVVERWSQYRCGRGRGRWTLRESAAPAGAAGEAAPRPYRGWVADQQWILDLPRLGGAAPLCRGQAVPDPPTRYGRQTRPRSVWLPWSRDPHGDVRRRPCGHAARSGACRPQQGIPRPTRASASTDSFPVQTADRLAARGAAPAQRVATAGRTGSARTTSRRSYRPSGIHVRSVRVSRSVCRSTARSLCATVCTSTTR